MIELFVNLEQQMEHSERKDDSYIMLWVSSVQFFSYGFTFRFLSFLFCVSVNYMSIEKVFEGGGQICAPVFDGHGFA